MFKYFITTPTIFFIFVIISRLVLLLWFISHDLRVDILHIFIRVKVKSIKRVGLQLENAF